MCADVHVRVCFNGRHVAYDGVVFQGAFFEGRERCVVRGHVDFAEVQAGEGLGGVVIRADVVPVPSRTLDRRGAFSKGSGEFYQGASMPGISSWSRGALPSRAGWKAVLRSRDWPTSRLGAFALSGSGLGRALSVFGLRLGFLDWS